MTRFARFANAWVPVVATLAGLVLGTALGHYRAAYGCLLVVALVLFFERARLGRDGGDAP